MSDVRFLWEGAKIFMMFHLTCLGWLFFRAGSVHQIGDFLRALTVIHGLSLPQDSAQSLIFYAALFAAVWIIKKVNGLLKSGFLKDMTGSAAAGIMVYFIFFHGGSSKAFIYFQF